MKWYLNLKIGKKLVSGFILIALICGAMGAYAIETINDIKNNDTQLYENMAVPLGEIGQISTEFQKIRVDTRDLVINTSDAEMKTIVEDIELRRKNLDELYASFEKTILSDKVRSEYEKMIAADKDYDKAIDDMMINALANKNVEAYSILKNEGSVAAKTLDGAISNLIVMKTEGAKDKSGSNDTAARNSSRIMLGIIAFVMALSVLIGLLISRIITKPLNKSVYMIEEMSKGHFSERLNIDTRDEIGRMANSMDNFADELQNNVIGMMNKISQGDVSMEISVTDSKDEISPAMKKTVETIRNLNNEVQKLIQAATEGKLDVRGQTHGYEGSWKELIGGVNGLIDAFVAPINVTAEYVERIGRGDIPVKITDTYLGDFNEIKNSLNTCIDAVNALVEDAMMLSDAAIEGKLNTRADASRHGGDFNKIVEGVNMTLDTLVGFLDAMPAPVMIMDNDFSIKYINTTGASLIGTPQKELVGTKCYNAFKTSHCNTEICACAKAMKRNEKVTEETDCHVNGLDLEISYTGIPIRDRSNKVIGALELVTDLTEIKKAAKVGAKQAEFQLKEVEKLITNLEKVSVGDLDLSLKVEETDQDTSLIGQNFEKINHSLHLSMEALKSMMEDVEMLSSAAVEGRLETRADAGKHRGGYKKIVEGVNNTLDAVIEPINEASAVLQEMAKGNLQITMNGEYRGDHAAIKNALNATITNMRSYVSEISEVLESISVGNLNLSITADYKGDFVEIKNSLNNILLSLNQVLGDINDAADQVSIGSKQVSDGSQALSQGATEQASSIEELTASVTEVASKTRENAGNAGEANELTLSVKDNAEQGNKHMAEMLEAMEEINESSSNISKIIKVIDDIAFQTNILALNAAVEAARAGQHGKGFAVVAEEVRNLAARSAEAAKETTELIQGSIKKSSKGTEIANNTAKALDEIVSGIAKTANIIAEIARSSNEQAMGISQINTGLNQVSQVVQNNAATAEESAASSEELSGQAEMLKEMVGRFSLRKGTHSLKDADIKLLESNNTYSTSSKKKSKTTSSIELNENEFDKY